LAKSVTRTLRLPNDLDEALEKKAREERISVNSLATSGIREAIEWSSVIPKLGFGTFPKYLTSKLLEELTDSECEEIGKQVARDLMVPFVEYRFGTSSFENWIETIREFANYTGQFKILTKTRGSEFVLVVEHSSGIKWSHYYKGAGDYIFGKILGKLVRDEITDSHCIARIT
jgi:hypothetical protein